MGHRSASDGRRFSYRAADASGRRLLAALVTVASFAAMTTTARAVDTTLQVVSVGLGSVTASPAPTSTVNADGEPCPSPESEVDGDRTAIVWCRLTYQVGTSVTLQASGGPADGTGPATTFARWSDDRCPAADRCALTLDADPRSVAALFSPQRVSVWVSGTGSVSSAPGGLAGTLAPPDCVSDADTTSPVTCSDDFALDTPVTLTATPFSSPGWLPMAEEATLPLCDSTSGADCLLTADRPRWASVGLGEGAVNNQIPPEVSVRFRIVKAGTGSGTVRGQDLDCGGQCAVDRKFGDGQTLLAVPDSGSRFDRWQAACGSNPNCRLAVGPVTAITAVFERASSPPGGQQQGTSLRRPLTARVLRLNVRGHGRRRAILIRLRVNADATVRAVLLRGRRQVASRRWRLRTGTHLLRFRVPVRARPGAYRVRLTIRGNSQTKQITRRVRLRR